MYIRIKYERILFCIDRLTFPVLCRYLLTLSDSLNDLSELFSHAVNHHCNDKPRFIDIICTQYMECGIVGTRQRNDAFENALLTLYMLYFFYRNVIPSFPLRKRQIITTFIPLKTNGQKIH